jgi:hypothetical protein
MPNWPLNSLTFDKGYNLIDFTSEAETKDFTINNLSVDQSSKIMDA